MAKGLEVRVVGETALPLKLYSRGKVRDTYEIDKQRLLIVTTDRISTYDHVHPTGIPHKGIILTQMSLFWFEKLKQELGVEVHLDSTHFNSDGNVTGDITNKLFGMQSELEKHAEILDRRIMVVKKANVVPIECVVRGYLAGSGWKEYQQNNTVCGVELHLGLRESEELPETIFTPATKEQKGHDRNISFLEAAYLINLSTMERVRNLSLRIYKHAAQYVKERGIIIADTKFEFGFVNGEIILIDEVLTPDSSRFWDAEKYEPGRSQDSLDKQYVRDFVDKKLKWNHEAPAPQLPPEVIRNTSQRYLEVYKRLTMS